MKYTVTHIEYGKLTGARFVVTDGEFTTAAEAERVAADLRDINHETYFVSGEVVSGEVRL